MLSLLPYDFKITDLADFEDNDSMEWEDDYNAIASGPDRKEDLYIFYKAYNARDTELLVYKGRVGDRLYENVSHITCAGLIKVPTDEWVYS